MAQQPTLLEIFLEELDQHVGAMNRDLLALESSPEDEDHLASLFRAMHSLKGASRIVELPELERLCHATEEFLSRVREGSALLGEHHFPLLFRVADALAEVHEQMIEGRPTKDGRLQGLSADVARLTGVGYDPDEPPLELEKVGATSGASEHEERGEPLAEPAENLEVSARGPAEDRVRVRASALDELQAAVDEMRLDLGAVRVRCRELEGLWADTARLRHHWRALEAGLLPGDRPGDGRRVEPEAIQKVSEALKVLEGSAERSSTSLPSAVRSLIRDTDSLRASIRSVGLRPFADACQGLPRAVRDAAAESGKRARLRIVGQEVEVQRGVVEKLRDPLLHLVRNSVDHGLESPAARRNLGKPEEGTILISAELRGGSLVVTVQDDGRGVDEGAVRKHLRDIGRSVPADHDGLVRALLQSGISTRERATSLSGRGVGLNVVQEAVESILGTVNAAWTQGQGTTFTLKCPATIGTMQAVVVRVGNTPVAVPTLEGLRLLRIPLAELQSAGGELHVQTPDRPVRVISLARLMGFRDGESGGLPDPLPLLLLYKGRDRLALAVDEFLAHEELIVRPLTSASGAFQHVHGGAQLPDGRTVLVVRPDALRMADGRASSGKGLTPRPSSAGAPPHILVVDDSITTRSLEQSVLEMAGFKVSVAVDGEDGWQRLREQGADLAVVDLEMPNIDGVQLCRLIRSSSRFRTLPVVILTSREDPESQRKAREAGADAYLTKSGFDQRGLLETIRGLLPESGLA